MKRCLALAALLLVPIGASAATLRADTVLTISESPLGNAYLAGSEVLVDALIPGDLAAAAGALKVTAGVDGDALIAAGSVLLSGPITGDVRGAGGNVFIENSVGGELAVFARRLIVSGPVNEVRAAGQDLELRSGAAGPVDLYGANVAIAGEFAGDVHIVSSDQIVLAEGTVIHGRFEYNAPQQADIPSSVVIDGGVHYIGSSSFLPTAEEAKTFALAGVGIFFLVRLVAAMLAAGLVAGLFPVFAKAVADEAIGRSLKRFCMLGFLGFALFIATPVLVILLLASFVGIGIAAIIGAAYLLLILLSYVYAASLAGAAFARFVLKRPGSSWRGAATGMLILYIVGLIPGIGLLVSFVLASVALGTVVSLWYRASFGKAAE